MVEDPVGHGALRDERDDPHRGAALGAPQRIDLEDLPQQLGAAASRVPQRERHRARDGGRRVRGSRGLPAPASRPAHTDRPSRSLRSARRACQSDSAPAAPAHRTRGARARRDCARSTARGGARRRCRHRRRVRHRARETPSGARPASLGRRPVRTARGARRAGARPSERLPQRQRRSDETLRLRGAASLLTGPDHLFPSHLDFPVGRFCSPHFWHFVSSRSMVMSTLVTRTHRASAPRRPRQSRSLFAAGAARSNTCDGSAGSARTSRLTEPCSKSARRYPTQRRTHA